MAGDTITRLGLTFVDLLAYSSILNPDLKAHIDRVGITIYKQ